MRTDYKDLLHMGPLSGLKIIDMTTVLMGPYADFGADVIKIEAPDGDLVRQIGPMKHEGMGAIFLNVNRSKRSISLNLKKSDGRDALIRLVKDADVLVYNVRAIAMARLGLSYETLKQVNPRLIYAGMFGYDQTGPYAGRPAYDDLIQGGALIPYLSSRVNNGKPSYVPAAIADRIVGMAAVNAILAAVIERAASV
jgi:crotonobetainyl-CoA:carnitine CoA-transferase CaiB-like acyl-CoA transferase